MTESGLAETSLPERHCVQIWPRKETESLSLSLVVSPCS